MSSDKGLLETIQVQLVGPYLAYRYKLSNAIYLRRLDKNFKGPSIKINLTEMYNSRKEEDLVHFFAVPKFAFSNIKMSRADGVI